MLGAKTLPTVHSHFTASALLLESVRRVLEDYSRETEREREEAMREKGTW